MLYADKLIGKMNSADNQTCIKKEG